MNITKKLMLAAGLCFQLSNLHAMANVNQVNMDKAKAVFTGVPAKSLNNVEVAKLVKQAGDTPEAHTLALHAIKGGANVTNKQRFPKAIPGVNAQAVLQSAPAVSAAAAQAQQAAAQQAATVHQVAKMHAATAQAQPSTASAQHNAALMSEAEIFQLAVNAGDEWFDALALLPEDLRHAIINKVHTVAVHEDASSAASSYDDTASATAGGSMHAHRSLGRLGSKTNATSSEKKKGGAKKKNKDNKDKNNKNKNDNKKKGAAKKNGGSNAKNAKNNKSGSAS